MPLACLKWLWKMFITSFLVTRRSKLIGSINKLSLGVGTCDGWLASFPPAHLFQRLVVNISLQIQDRGKANGIVITFTAISVVIRLQDIISL